jgi:metal-responsive CopG/Arc/MetJ family transcriptional regulator
MDHRNYLSFAIAPKPGVGSVITNIRLARDMLPRIDRVLYGGELRSDFIRAAIEAELQRREREATKPVKK